MSDLNQTREQLLAELGQLRERIADLEAAATRERSEHTPLRAALNASVNAIVLTDRAGTIQWVNPAFCTLTGYSAAEAVGRNPRELVKSGHHGPEFYRGIWETILSGRVWLGETINRRRDGSLYTEEQAITPVRNAEGEITHFIAVKQDVTERKRAEADLRANAQIAAVGAEIGLSLNAADSVTAALQQCAQALVTHLDVAAARIWLLNERGDSLDLRASAGLPTDETDGEKSIPIGHSIVGRIASERRPYTTNSVSSEPAAPNSGWTRREAIQSFAGHPLVVGNRLMGVMAVFARHPLPDAVVAAMSSLSDHVALGIERHRTIDIVRTTEERMRFALQSAHVGVWDIDFPTGELTWSEVLEAQYGLDAGTFEGTFNAYVDRIHPDDRQASLEAMRSAERTGGDFVLQHRIIRVDGTVRWIEGAGRIVLGPDSQPTRGIGISVDVTDRRKLEDQFRQAQKMEAVGRLAAGVAHDFNNLLTAILGYSELLLADSAHDDPRLDDIEEIRKAGARGAGLTRQLLAFSRKQIVEPRLLNLNTVVEGMRAMLVRLIGEDIDVSLKLAPDAAPVVADPAQIEQVVMNLAINARDAMPLGGTLTISTANLELDDLSARTREGLKPGSYVTLRVTDTGTGITPDVQAHLFEPFYTTKEAGKGTGLGLATVYGIVTQSGGHIGVTSELGRGASFDLCLPAAKHAPFVSEKRVQRAHGTGTETVLVVDDAEGVRQLVRRVLQRQGYNVLTCSKPDEALAMLAQGTSLDLLVTDVVMRGGSGPELARQMLQQRPGIKVIYMSGYTEDAIAHHGVLKPGLAFLHKPFTADELGRKVRDVLDD
jgi:PAS domain S-box-containing protein